MKKLITKFFIAAGFVALFTTANAQIGVRIGANLANASVSGDDEGEFKMRPGFSAGLFYQIQSGSLTIQPEINFAQQGTKFSFDFLGSKVESTFTMNYIQVPILVKYGFGDMEKLNFFVEAGPYLGMGIGKAKAETCVDGGDCETEETEYGSDEEQIKNPDFGAQFGAGVNINKNISVDVRYVLGLSNLVNNATDDESWKNNAINIGVGYKF
ncbi:MAG TPA: porin family protein [Saprospiraceae bacterium]|nr:porin family protein [Saprospiraceae bacterium]